MDILVVLMHLIFGIGVFALVYLSLAVVLEIVWTVFSKLNSFFRR